LVICSFTLIYLGVDFPFLFVGLFGFKKWRHQWVSPLLLVSLFRWMLSLFTVSSVPLHLIHSCIYLFVRHPEYYF
jgi:hypothetical protein